MFKIYKIVLHIPVLFLTLLLLPGFSNNMFTAYAEAPEFLEIGWIERVRVQPGNVLLHAKMDTGADHCSLHAKNIEFFKRSKKRWVRFSVRTRRGEEHQLELPVVRIAKIKRVKGATQERPVVQLKLCLAGEMMEVDVNLVDRSNFAYPMLVGRSFLAGSMVINPAKTFTADARCEKESQTK